MSRINLPNHWIMEGAKGIAPFTLLMKHGYYLEDPGLSGKEQQRVATSVSAEDWRSIRTNGLPLTPIEQAVHHRVKQMIGHGAMAAAKVRLHAGAHDFRRSGSTYVPYDEHEILANPLCVGSIQDEVSNPPFIALGRDWLYADCIILTWSTRWIAFRGRMKLSELVTGEKAFIEAFPAHLTAVKKMMGESLLALTQDTTCVS